MIAVAGCGSSGSSTTEGAKPLRTGVGGSAEKEAPKGASPVLRGIYRQFPPPKPDPAVKGSAAAIKAGERACKGRTPLQVKREYIGRAKLLPEQRRMVAQLPRFEKEPPSSDFVAGQLAALVYETAQRRKAIATYAYQGCVYSLARGLEHRLAPGKKGS